MSGLNDRPETMPDGPTPMILQGPSRALFDRLLKTLDGVKKTVELLHYFLHLPGRGQFETGGVHRLDWNKALANAGELARGARRTGEQFQDLLRDLIRADLRQLVEQGNGLNEARIIERLTTILPYLAFDGPLDLRDGHHWCHEPFVQEVARFLCQHFRHRLRDFDAVFARFTEVVCTGNCAEEHRRFIASFAGCGESFSAAAE